MNGFAQIAIQKGEGVCGIQMQPAYPNLLLINDSTETIFQYIVFAFGVLLLVPCSCIAIKRRSKEIEFFHPGQERLGCILIIESIVFISCLITYIYAEATSYESYTAQMLAFWIFFAGIHMVMLLLQNALAIVETQDHPESHHGIGLVRLCPVITFSLLFIFFVGFQILIICMQAAHYSVWDGNYTMFVVFHDIITVRVFEWIIFGCAALVQMIKLCNFCSHSRGHSPLEKRCGSHKCFACLGMLLSLASICLLLANCYFIMYYESVAEIILITYECLQVFVMIPLLHMMIIKQEATGQKNNFAKLSNQMNGSENSLY